MADYGGRSRLRRLGLCLIFESGDGRLWKAVSLLPDETVKKILNSAERRWMARVKLVSKLKTEGATLAPRAMHPPGNEAPVHPAGAFPFAHRIEANIAKLGVADEEILNQRNECRARWSFVIEILYSVLVGVSMHPQEMAPVALKRRGFLFGAVKLRSC